MILCIIMRVVGLDVDSRLLCKDKLRSTLTSFSRPRIKSWWRFTSSSLGYRITKRERKVVVIVEVMNRNHYTFLSLRIWINNHFSWFYYFSFFQSWLTMVTSKRWKMKEFLRVMFFWRKKYYWEMVSFSGTFWERITQPLENVSWVELQFWIFLAESAKH